MDEYDDIDFDDDDDDDDDDDKEKNQKQQKVENKGSLKNSFNDHGNVVNGPKFFWQ